MITIIRNIFFKFLGLPKSKLINNLDFIYLKDDSNTKMGIKSYDNGAKVWRWSASPLIIGKYCSIARDVNFIMDHGSHLSSSISNFPILDSFYSNEFLFKDGETKEDKLKKMIPSKPIRVGHDVWIGMGAYILPGITIGNGAIIAANSVVTKDVKDYTVVGGSPAKELSVKLTPDQANKLNKIAWWDWNEMLVKERYQDFYGDTNDFIEKYFNED